MSRKRDNPRVSCVMSICIIPRLFVLDRARRKKASYCDGTLRDSDLEIRRWLSERVVKGSERCSEPVVGSLNVDDEIRCITVRSCQKLGKTPSSILARNSESKMKLGKENIVF